MSVIEFDKQSSEPEHFLETMNNVSTPQELELRAILDTALDARARAQKLGLNFETYLLHTAVLALSERLDQEE